MVHYTMYCQKCDKCVVPIITYDGTGYTGWHCPVCNELLDSLFEDEDWDFDTIHNH
jgi:hypothetical protein